ncbi:hypothetical protein [Sphingosinicella sp. CPCC 101087]|uniref:hypothetical protein n=1 Tax=Sphingosinicella sp. CPCC 101087 TaxID=2497754 RepID=UPI00101B7D0B|nr:hypothetical protein [Sphingosinicella sp. CPCC 101087]
MSRRLVLAGGLAGLCGCGVEAQATGTLIEQRTFSGNRGTGSGGAGGEGLRATDGMRIANSIFRDLGNGAVRVSRPVTGLTIEDCQGDNLYRFLEVTVSTGGADASLTDFAVRRVRAEGIEHGFSRIRYRSGRGLIEDVTAVCRESGGNDYCVGFQLEGEASEITYRRAIAQAFQESSRPSSSYWNGDGFTDERGNSAIRYIECAASNCTDGGFDLKSSGVMLHDCVARGNKRNFRLWASGELQGCESHEPVWRGGSGGKSHFSFHGDVGSYRIVRPTVRASEGNEAPVFMFATNGQANITIVDADIDAPSAPLIRVESGPEPNIVFEPERSQQRIRTAS